MKADGQFENLDAPGHANTLSSKAVASHLAKDSYLTKIAFFREVLE